MSSRLLRNDNISASIPSYIREIQSLTQLNEGGSYFYEGLELQQYRGTDSRLSFQFELAPFLVRYHRCITASYLITYTIHIEACLVSTVLMFLGNNKLNGTLSATKSSRLLNVSYNNLAGRFPSRISELNLELNLVANNFTVVASNLRKVYVIDVIGAILDELWSLTYLTNLNLGQNYLAGNLSPSIGNLTRMQYLTIGIHASSGELPKELGMLTDLKVLYFVSSGVSGETPLTFANLQSLAALWASDNELTGRIPDLIGNWSKLTSLLLRNDNISASIPSYIREIKSLTKLNEGGSSTNWLKSSRTPLSSDLECCFKAEKLADMICAIAELESDRQPLSTKWYGKKTKETALGIMQILPKTAEWLVRDLGYQAYEVEGNPENLYRPFVSVYFGLGISIFEAFCRVRSEEFIVRAYNGGPKKATHKSTLTYWKRYLSVKESLPSRYFTGAWIPFSHKEITNSRNSQECQQWSELPFACNAFEGPIPTAFSNLTALTDL
ncbi:hypothetical protein DKX38_011380 [Salix brachista]|uniref:Uncharacterized protein n=1 Tax=Salix brachista TaxID=2182728 RepID=A0A5N5LYK0_9ROSI|nr:hypothetical protein DKX38_011380 [Salix brachista]